MVKDFFSLCREDPPSSLDSKNVDLSKKNLTEIPQEYVIIKMPTYNLITLMQAILKCEYHYSKCGL